LYVQIDRVNAEGPRCQKNELDARAERTESQRGRCRLGRHEMLTYMIRDIIRALRYDPQRDVLRQKYHVEAETVFDVHDNQE
jgi:hypothetical protein